MHEDADLANGEHSPPKPRRGAGIYATPEEALRKLSSEFEYWSGRLTDVSLQMCYALIGANWVISGASINGIVKNPCATWSLILVLLALASNVVAAFVLCEALRSRFDYGERDSARWASEFKASIGRNVAWPFSDLIQNFGKYMRWMKVGLTLASGALLIAAALAKG
jgi:hypothetical protein